MWASIKRVFDKMNLSSDAGRNIVKDSCPIIVDNPPSNIKRQKVAAAKDPMHHGLLSSPMAGGESKGYDTQENVWCPDGARSASVSTTPDNPFRSSPALDVQLNSDNLLEMNDKDDSNGRKLAKDNGDKDCFAKHRWNYDLERLTALITQAKEYIHWSNIKNFGSKEVPPKKSNGVCQINSTESDLLHKVSRAGGPKPSIEIMQHEDASADQKLGESVAVQDLEGSPENVMKTEGSVLKAHQTRKPSPLESKLEDNEDEICVLSPSQWNTLRPQSKRKCENGIIPTRKKGKNSQSWSTSKSVGECSKVVENQGVQVIDLESIETECVETHLERSFEILDECTSSKQDKEDKLPAKLEADSVNVPPQLTNAKSVIHMKPEEVCIEDDISEGKENFPIRAINGLDNDRYLPFTYITNICYPTRYKHIKPIGCNCTNGCSDSHPCHCVSKNGGEIPFNETGEIVRARPIVHECGPSCKCPPSCMNRVSQHGPRYQLEIFKTVGRGWGVRSRNYISSGGFICEYIGELLRDNEAEQRINNDEYLFDISDSKDEGNHGKHGRLRGSKSNDEEFAIDAAKFGNIGRFINHSCSPNLYAQEVLYDHGDIRMPHIMFFATRNIHPLQELFYDYNYKMDRVCDVNGNIKTKECHCGSRKCKGRMY